MAAAAEAVARQVVAMMVQDVPFPSPSASFSGWSPSSLALVLSSLSRLLLLPPPFLGRQSPSLPRRRPAAHDAARRALRFYSWAHASAALAPSEPPCRAMARLLARARALPPLWRFLRAHSAVLTTASVTDVLSVLAREGLAAEALFALHRMKQLRCRPDAQSYNVVMAALCAAGRFGAARRLLERMELPWFPYAPDRYTYTVLIAAYCRRALDVGQRKAVRRRIWEANHMFRRMLIRGLEPDVVTYNCLINGLCKTYRIERAREVFDEMLLKGCVPNRVTYDSFVRYYCRVNEVDEAVSVMRSMDERGHGVPSTSSYTPIIHALCETGRAREAAGFVEEMVGRGHVPRELTYKLLLDALAREGDDGLPVEVVRKIERGIRDRKNYVARFKPILPMRNGYS